MIFNESFNPNKNCYEKDHESLDGNNIYLTQPDKPKRPMSAYNVFFQQERQKILNEIPEPGNKPRGSHGKIGFTQLARYVATKWKKLDKYEREPYERVSAIDKARYRNEKKEWVMTTTATSNEYIRNDLYQVQNAVSWENQRDPIDELLPIEEIWKGNSMDPYVDTDPSFQIYTVEALIQELDRESQAYLIELFCPFS